MDQCSASSHKADFPFGRRILSIDGGGILGTFPISFLAEIEQHLDPTSSTSPVKLEGILSDFRLTIFFTEENA